jgi:hypothetical protein
VARTSLVCALLLSCAGLSFAGDSKQPERTVIRLNVSPMAEPLPALRYQLLPELREMHAGNPIQGYLICFMEQNHFFHSKQAVEKREKYQSMPLAELPLEELKDYGGSALKQADYAARLTTPDWQILHKLKRDGINLLLPEVQQLRSLAAALKVRFRAEVAEKRFDDAVRTAKTMLALARHLGEHPTLIAELVGVAVAYLALGPLEEMIGQPGCPNLYWALTQLPEPFIDLRHGVQGERAFLSVELALLDDSKPMTPADLDRVVKKVQRLLEVPGGEFRKDKGGVEPWLAARAKDEAVLRAARRRLVELGVPAERVKRFPARQVLLVAERRAAEVERDDAMKLMPLPHWRLQALLGSRLTTSGTTHVAGGSVGGASGRPVVRQSSTLFTDFIPGVVNVHRAAARLQQRLALLRHVEALRLYAAGHGKLPPKLADLEVPLPVDPMTGKAFSYHQGGTKATLRGTPPRGAEKIAVYNMVYEVTLRK